MIQVIDRTFTILEFLGNGPSALRHIAEAAKLPRNTTSNILKTLKDRGYLVKDADGIYALSDRFGALVAAAHTDSTVLENAVRELAASIGESAVIAELRGVERYTVAEAKFDREVAVSTAVYRGRSFYGLETTWALLAFSDEKTRSAVIDARGLPTADEWAHAQSRESFLSTLDKIRRDGSAIRIKNETAAMSVPVIEENGSARYALGVFLPASRFRGENKEKIGRAMVQSARRLAVQIQKNGGRA